MQPVLCGYEYSSAGETFYGSKMIFVRSSDEIATTFFAAMLEECRRWSVYWCGPMPLGARLVSYLTLDGKPRF